MEIFAPIGSSHLDSVKGRDLNVLDYSSGDDSSKPARYALVMEDGTELILDMIGEYGPQIVDIMYMYYPRKVFKN